MILVLQPGLGLDAIHEVEAAVRRAGGEPRRLFSQNDDGAHQAIEAKGIHASALAGVAGVAFVLDGKSLFPRVARCGDERKEISISPKRARAVIGGKELVLIAGPCAVENLEQLEACARMSAEAGATILRGGAFKPRTSPYSFQGMGEEGLLMMRAVAERHGLAVLTEVLEPSAVPLVSEHADALQVGSRNMQNFPLLRAVGRQTRPVMLKRGMSATLDEWLLAAEYIADAGNENIILCERGVRGFDPASRNLLDLAAVPLLRERTSLPIVVDPSHGVGVRSAISAMALAAVAAGADGLMLECHPDPGVAKSDGFQALLPGQLRAIAVRARAVANLVR
ncbi:MAG: 3-deoxy-7-phosphoheptulonate synthase [Polyangiaceae bacterium]